MTGTLHSMADKKKFHCVEFKHKNVALSRFSEWHLLTVTFVAVLTSNLLFALSCDHGRVRPVGTETCLDWRHWWIQKGGSWCPESPSPHFWFLIAFTRTGPLSETPFNPLSDPLTALGTVPHLKASMYCIVCWRPIFSCRYQSSHKLSPPSETFSFCPLLKMRSSVIALL